MVSLLKQKYQKMKILSCQQFGPIDSLQLIEVPTPQPKAKEILIEVKACGANFPDILLVEGKYQFRPDFPFAPGGEVAGIIKEVGEEAKGFKVGDKVVAFTGWGGYAEAVVTHYSRVFLLPEGIDWEVASSCLYTFGTVYHALKDRANLQKGETLLVLGAAGGIGLATVELGKYMGATVIAAASTDEKLQVCQQKGADHLINYQEQDLKKSVKTLFPNGVDIILDPVGGQYTEPALRTIGWNGRYLVVGFTAGDIPKIPLNLPLLKGCQIVGVFWGAFSQRHPKAYRQQINELMLLLKEGKIQSHIQATYSLEEAKQALHALQNRKAIGKLVITP